MKRYISFFFLCCLSTTIFAQKYYPEGTNWIELRLDTTKYESWYTTIEEDGIVKTIPNYVETHYYVKGDTIPKEGYIQQYKIVWQKKEDGVDSLQFLISENLNDIEVATLNLEETTSRDPFSYPSGVYSFDDWQTGKLLTYMDLYTAQLTGYHYSVFCTISEIKEKSFGGCRPLKYVETDGGQILIQGIGVTSWDDYYCIFGPARLNEWLYFDCEDNYERQEKIKKTCSHYRSMLVHFERNGEVLYDVWPSPEGMTNEEDNSIFCEGRSWKYEHSKTDWQSLTEEQILNGDYHSLGDVTDNYWLRIEGDELFDGRQCKKIVYDGFSGTGLYGYGYEDDGRVMVYALMNEPAFYAPFPLEQWVMLYDFNVAKDSHCDMGAFWHRDLIVSVEGTVKVGDTDKRFIGLSNAKHPTWPLLYAVDGIGCSSGLFEFENLITDGSSSRFVGCYDGDVCIFSAEDFKALTTPKDAYRPFVEEGKVWNMEKVSTWVGWPDYGVVRTEKWELKGDTVINGVTYKNYYEEGVYRGAIREENQKVYIQYKFNNQEVLLYDFGLKEGERFTTYDGQEYVFTSEDYVEYDNKELRRMELVNVNDSRDINYWIEGIGALAGPTTPFYYGMTGGEDSSIASCYVGEQCIYRRDPDSIQLPTKDTQKPTYFDLSGRRLQQKPQKGIYIQDGRVMIQR